MPLFNYIPDELIYEIYNFVNPMTIIHSHFVNKRTFKLISNDEFLYKQYRVIKLFQQNLDKINWIELTMNKVISEDFIDQNAKNIRWDYIYLNESLNDEFYERHCGKIDWYIKSSYAGNGNNNHIIRYQYEGDFIKFYQEKNIEINKFNNCSCNEDATLDDHCFKCKIWRQTLTNRRDYMKKDKQKQGDFSSLYRSIKLDMNHIENNINNMNWDSFCKYANIDTKFFDKYQDKIVWNAFSSNTNIDPSYYQKHANKLKWYEVCKNEFNL